MAISSKRSLLTYRLVYAEPSAKTALREAIRCRSASLPSPTWMLLQIGALAQGNHSGIAMLASFPGQTTPRIIQQQNNLWSALQVTEQIHKLPESQRATSGSNVPVQFQFPITNLACSSLEWDHTSSAREAEHSSPFSLLYDCSHQQPYPYSERTRCPERR